MKLLGFTDEELCKHLYDYLSKDSNNVHKSLLLKSIKYLNPDYSDVAKMVDCNYTYYQMYLPSVLYLYSAFVNIPKIEFTLDIMDYLQGVQLSQWADDVNAGLYNN